jgi:hypothetical protein
VVELLKVSGGRALKIGVVGISLGALAGLCSLLVRDGVSATARVTALVFWGMAVLPTATLLVMAMNDLQAGDHVLYLSNMRALGTLLLANVAGTALASVFFYVLATSTPSLLKGLDLLALRQAVGQRIGWTGFAVILAAAAIGAGSVAAWAHRRACA